MERKYDAIVFWQSIEHLVEAPKILKRCTELLEEKGVVIIGTVEPKSLQAKLFGRYWLHLDAPRHVYLFPQQALINFMHSCGLKKLGTITNDRDTNSINRVGLLVSMHHFLKLPSKNIFNKSLYWIWRCIICRLIDPIFQSAGYIVIFGNE